MRALTILSLLTLCLGACASLPATQRTPYLPAGVYGTYQDNDVGAINQSSWAFSSPANTRGNPVAAIKAVIALEYLPGELSENPRWIAIPDSVTRRMGRARDELRKILGVHMNAPSQLVVNTLLALSVDLQTGNQPAAMQVLGSPVFTLPPQQTLRILSNLPYVQQANLATARAEQMFLAQGGGRG